MGGVTPEGKLSMDFQEIDSSALAAVKSYRGHLLCGSILVRVRSRLLVLVTADSRKFT